MTKPRIQWCITTGFIGTALVALLLIDARPHAQVPETLTPWGDPSFEGTWLSINTDRVPFQRPQDEDDSVLHELVEAGVIERVVRRDRFPLSPFQAELVGEVRQNTLAAWRGSGWWRGSLVVDPPDGRLPPLTAAGRDRAATAWRTSDSVGPWNRAADLGPVERCVSRGVLGSMIPSLDYHGMEIVQAPGLVAIRHEALHETRVIWLDGRPHASEPIRGYLGDSRGHWDEGVLVVETRNLNGKTGARGHGNELPASERLRLIERFTRTDAHTLLYEVTVDDPGTWTAPWKMSFPLTRAHGYILSEFACHEGNYAIRNILSAARALDASRR
jgi:hypothetical protein